MVLSMVNFKVNEIVSDNSLLPIGIFDSGLGGLTVLKELKARLPNESFIYLGDNARNPYGPKSKDKINSISLENSLFLLERGVKAIVVACNTATVVAKDNLSKSLPIPVVGVVEPVITAAISATKNKKIGVIGTHQTILSDLHRDLILKQDSSIQVFTKPTPLFASIVEEGFCDKESTKMLIEEELNYFKNIGVDVLILGCTHYPFLKSQINSFFNNEVTLIDASEETSLAVSTLLDDLSIASSKKSTNSDWLYMTDRSVNFKTFSSQLINLNDFNVEQISLSELEDLRLNFNSNYNDSIQEKELYVSAVTK